MSLRLLYLIFAQLCGWLVLRPEGAENLRHLGKGLAERGGAFGMRRAGLGPTGGGMIFGLWA
jgi:hypothetical protein